MPWHHRISVFGYWSRSLRSHLIQLNMLMHPDDVKTVVAGVQLSREIADSPRR
jgi:hypothetical protein